MKSRQAFTLIELLVVIVIIAILAGLILPLSAFPSPSDAEKVLTRESSVIQAASIKAERLSLLLMAGRTHVDGRMKGPNPLFGMRTT